ncbi:hypothetical protein D0A37_05795 [Microcoleus vaginatus HSN003]|nr:hypothetical protein D0A37_05795 [Microcoleus vaginatus HSN003]
MLTKYGFGAGRHPPRYKQGNIADEIAAEWEHLGLAQVEPTLTYSHENRAEIEADLVAEESEYER